MPRGEPTRAQLTKGLEYVAQKPAFLQNFGAPPPRQDDDDEPRYGRDGRELPSRPKEGAWAAGSGDEGEDSGDEWDKMYGGGDDGPQVVVLKEGRHLNAEEVARERRRAAGLPSPPPEDSKDKGKGAEDKPKSASTSRSRPTPAGAKRKLVGEAVAAASASDKKKKKKSKAVKGLLSFDEAEGEA